MIKRLDTLILSVLPKCNLNCQYCHNDIYYSHTKIKDNMPMSLVRKAMYDYADYLNSTSIGRGVICLTGGEPLLSGYKYIKEIISIRNELENQYDLCLEIDIQTNGTLINEKWCDLFEENKIGLGISIDGNPKLTDQHRVFSDNNGRVSDLITKSIETIKRKEIKYGILMVATSSSVGHEGELLKYFRSLSPESVAFTPCIDKGPIITPKKYEMFLCNLFDEWTKSGSIEPEIRMFKFIRQKLTNCLQMPTPCEWGNDCPNTICVSADGKVWVCDVYMGNKEGYLGDVKTQIINEIVLSNQFNSFHNDVRTIPEECKSCEALIACNGGCTYRRNDGKDYFCEATKSVFNKIKIYIEQQLGSISLTISDSDISIAEQSH